MWATFPLILVMHIPQYIVIFFIFLEFNFFLLYDILNFLTVIDYENIKHW